MTEIVLDTPYALPATATGEYIRYTLPMVAGQAVRFTLTDGGTAIGDADLIAAFDFDPDYDLGNEEFGSYNGGNDEALVAVAPADGTLHLAVYAYDAFENITLLGTEVEAGTPPDDEFTFRRFDYTPSKHGQASLACYGGGRWVCFATRSGPSSIKAYWSDNGTSWAEANIVTALDPVAFYLATGDVRAISHDGTKFIALCGQGASLRRVLSSLDGKTWQDEGAVGPTISGTYSNLVWAGDKFVMVHNTGRVLYSATGLSWTDVSLGHTVSAHDTLKLAWNGTRLVLTGYYHNSGGTARVFYSSDGITWTPGFASAFEGLTVNGTDFIGINFDGVVYSSADGITFGALGVPAVPDPSQVGKGFAWDGEKYVCYTTGFGAASDTINKLRVTTDFSVWIDVAVSLERTAADYVVVDGAGNSFLPLGAPNQFFDFDFSDAANSMLLRGMELFTPQLPIPADPVTITRVGSYLFCTGDGIIELRSLHNPALILRGYCSRYILANVATDGEGTVVASTNSAIGAAFAVSHDSGETMGLSAGVINGYECWGIVWDGARFVGVTTAAVTVTADGDAWSTLAVAGGTPTGITDIVALSPGRSLLITPSTIYRLEGDVATPFPAPGAGLRKYAYNRSSGLLCVTGDDGSSFVSHDEGETWIANQFGATGAEGMTLLYPFGDGFLGFSHPYFRSDCMIGSTSDGLHWHVTNAPAPGVGLAVEDFAETVVGTSLYLAPRDSVLRRYDFGQFWTGFVNCAEAA